ncbi:DUF3149 domain-containing protein [Wohlfahrtiimonas chitiniclastica]|uniref:DUF3149 domain-containing protein n=2 Tax=Wohlfahrtiimonas chitiniclastica TaxID=400946 RepID=L8XXP3_9GAMM|nr:MULTISPECIES: DUF3149 domain-containing protein [Wohlfahrtiimonas]ELV07574.1 Hypothetical protein F387_01378 [Wohlfahrtiimonas chitiniclastica SH04]KZS23558.1 hypothetical protein BMY_1425 [Wohlfahrtiimonas chitiniclastica]MBS7814831.1 DUF3149 domain-containing protein [Wohlfahrtiimonas chitiniclastica]MBS7820730.1 DUF3149 domain-containing protein [Wohlfahrtiimonas chitiniclastica]MBS7824822.1 DUF3149 domain-containing protein [Wohlfahrtiimonas chitiniclastica]
MGWFTMPVMFSLLGVAFIIGFAAWMYWFVSSKIKEENSQSQS